MPDRRLQQGRRFRHLDAERADVGGAWGLSGTRRAFARVSACSGARTSPVARWCSRPSARRIDQLVAGRGPEEHRGRNGCSRTIPAWSSRAGRRHQRLVVVAGQNAYAARAAATGAGSESATGDRIHVGDQRRFRGGHRRGSGRSNLRIWRGERASSARWAMPHQATAGTGSDAVAPRHAEAARSTARGQARLSPVGGGGQGPGPADERGRFPPLSPATAASSAACRTRRPRTPARPAVKSRSARHRGPRCARRRSGPAPARGNGGPSARNRA